MFEFFLKNPGRKTLQACASLMSETLASSSVPGSSPSRVPHISCNTHWLLRCVRSCVSKTQVGNVRRTRHCPQVWRFLCEIHKCCLLTAHLDGIFIDSPWSFFQDVPVRVNLFRIAISSCWNLQENVLCFKMFLLTKVAWQRKTAVPCVSGPVSPECSTVLKCEFMKKV